MVVNLRVGYELNTTLLRKKGELCCLSYQSELNESSRHDLLQKVPSNVRIVFEYAEWDKIRLAGQALVSIIVSKAPPMSSALWKLRSLENAFSERCTKPIWRLRNSSLALFLSLFPRTFDVLGYDSQYVRLRHTDTRTILDSKDDVMRNCASTILHATESTPSFRLLMIGTFI